MGYRNGPLRCLALIFRWTKWPSFRSRHFQMFFRESDVLYFDLSYTKFVPKGPLDDKAVLDQVMAWRRTGEKPLPVWCQAIT